MYRENVRELGGYPLIPHSIRTARRLSEVDGIFVSTDCDKIAGIAREYGAEVIHRPAELASDTASEWDAWRHAVSVLEEQGRPFDLFLSLPATSPLRAAEDVEACLKMMDAETDVVITVRRRAVRTSTWSRAPLTAARKSFCPAPEAAAAKMPPRSST